MKVSVIPGVGPGHPGEAAPDRHLTWSADLQGFSVDELAQVVGRTHAQSLTDLAYARDDRAVEPERETKSISVEDTFETDRVDLAELGAILHRDARQVAARLQAAGLFARTVTIKVRLHDFSTYTRSRTLLSATDNVEVISAVAQSLLGAVDATGGVRLLGVGVAGLTDVLQEDLFADDVVAPAEADPAERRATETAEPETDRTWPTGSSTSNMTIMVAAGSGAPASAGSRSGSRPAKPLPVRYGPSRSTTPRCVRSGLISRRPEPGTAASTRPRNRP